MTDIPWHLLQAEGTCETVHNVRLSDCTGAPLALTCRKPAQGVITVIVVFCHGLGSNGQAYGRLTGTWAARGYVVIHPTFPDAIESVARAEPDLGLNPDNQDLSEWTALPNVRTRMHETLHAPSFWLRRLAMVARIADEMDEVLRQIRVTVRDLPWVIAGHSFGAYTAQLVAGAEIDFPGQQAQSFCDDRFAAAIALSGQGRAQQGLRHGSWDRVFGPMRTVTGTRDGGPLGQDWR
ncbi:MAG: putative dienelactone hydrolase [Paracoccaceae bacterium]|jgi:predicted dienelactone hydrolase